MRLKQGQRALEFANCGLRDLDGPDTRVLNDQGMKIVQIVSDETGHQRMLDKEIVRSPVAEEKGERIGVIIEGTRQGRGDEVTGTYVAGDLRRGFAQSHKIRSITEIAREKFDSEAR